MAHLARDVAYALEAGDDLLSLRLKLWDVMRHHVGPAAGKLVASGRFGTFRAMETAAVLF